MIATAIYTCRNWMPSAATYCPADCPNAARAAAAGQSAPFEATQPPTRLDGIDLVAVRTNDPATEPIIALVKEANRLQFEDERFVNELIEWIRFSRKDVDRTHDGLTASALGFPSIPRWLGRLIMRKLVTPEAEAKKCEKAIRSSSLVLLFITRTNDHKHWVDLRRAFERVALTAASLGIAHAHLNMPCEVPSVREKLAEHLGLQRGEQPLLLIRLGYARPAPRAPRRPVEEVLQTPA